MVDTQFDYLPVTWWMELSITKVSRTVYFTDIQTLLEVLRIMMENCLTAEGREGGEKGGPVSWPRLSSGMVCLPICPLEIKKKINGV